MSDKLKRKKLTRNYPTKEEYFQKIEKIRNAEVKSGRYATIYAFLTNNYWNRENIDLESELFNIIGIRNSATSEETILERYENSKRFIESLTEEQINSNILLKRAYTFWNIIDEDNDDILSTLYNQIDNQIDENHIKDFMCISLPIPAEIQKLVLNSITEMVRIKYYRPSERIFSYIDLLDVEHRYVYDDYSLLAIQIERLAEKIYFLKLNKLLFNNQSLECSSVNISQYQNISLTVYLVNHKKEENNTLVLKKN